MFGLPRWLSDKESACQCRRHRRCGFSPWIRKIPLEEKMATHSSILAQIIPPTEESGRLQVRGVAKSQTQLSTAHTHATAPNWWYSGHSILTHRWFLETCDPVPAEHEHQNPRYWTIVSSHRPLISIPSWPTGNGNEGPMWRDYGSVPWVLVLVFCRHRVTGFQEPPMGEDGVATVSPVGGSSMCMCCAQLCLTLCNPADL